MLGWVDTPVIDRAQLTSRPRGGPLIVQEYDATCLVPHSVDAALDGFGNIRLTRPDLRLRGPADACGFIQGGIGRNTGVDLQ